MNLAQGRYKRQTIINTVSNTTFQQKAGKMASLGEKLHSFFVYVPYLSRMTPSHIMYFVKEAEVVRIRGYQITHTKRCRTLFCDVTVCGLIHFTAFRMRRVLASAQSVTNSLSEEWYYSGADITVTINIATADRTASQARQGIFIVTTCLIHKTSVVN